MKKYSLLLLLGLISFVLFGCGEKPLTPLDITVQQETVYYGDITIDVILNDATYSSSDILEISHSVASQTYLKYSSEIGQTETSLTINFYLDETAFNDQEVTYGFVVYHINSNDIPGISTFDSSLIE